MAEMAEIARAVHWLNPEPKAYWDTGDSVMSKYGRYCTDVHEVRNLRQLEDFVEAVAESSMPGRAPKHQNARYDQLTLYPVKRIRSSRSCPKTSISLVRGRMSAEEEQSLRAEKGEAS